jgi:DNA-directed RNA polymerase alpha subunit
MNRPIDQLSGEHYEFIIDADVSICNAIRKYIISGVPSSVIDTVCIKENDTNYSDEYISHRLGQIPLKISGDNYYWEENTILLEETGPKKVYSRDIRFPNDILIMILGPNETISLTGTIEEGSVFDQGHSKFSVSCGTTYIKKNDSLFHFKVETTGCVSAKDALRKAVELIRDDVIAYKRTI